MNKKADLHLSINAIVVLILAITMLGLGLTFMKDKMDNFNPEEDVCLEKSTGHNLGNHIFDINNPITNPREFEDKYNKYDGNIFNCIEDDNKYGDNPYMLFSFICDSCSDWRPKTKCELDPNEVDCICDEYDKDIKKVFVYKIPSNNFTLNFTYPGNCELVLPIVSCSGDNLEDCNILVEDYICKTPICIKAHEPNECELNNPNYVNVWVDYDKPKCWKNETSEGCINGEFICRPKELKDFSCKELKKAWDLEWEKLFLNKGKLLDWLYYDNCESEGFWSWSGTDCSKVKLGNRESVYDVMIDKGCEI